MKNLSIRSLLMFSFTSIAALLLAILLISTLSTTAENDVSRRQADRYAAYLLADELRQSSDDLTRLARTFVVTGGQADYEQQYNDILDIRNGKKPRPAEYHRIYWDFVAAGQSKPRPDSITESLQSLMKKAGFTAEEFGKLDQAAANSNGLVQTEVKAMNAVKGRFDDGKGGYTLVKAPDLELARNLMHSPEYHKFKAKIMEPVDEFFVLLDNRTNTAVAESKARTVVLRTWLIIAEVVALACTVLFCWLLFAKIVPPMRRIGDSANKMAQGDFDVQLDTERKDEVGHLANCMRTMQKAVHAMAADASMLSDAAVAGQLETRADASKHQGDFQKIVSGVNDTLDAVIGPLNVAANYVDRISHGDIPHKITDT